MLGIDVQFTSHESAIQERWRTWWEENRGESRYSTLPWRKFSPRLAAAADALFQASVERVPADADELVKLALARNPGISPRVEAELGRRTGNVYPYRPGRELANGVRAGCARAGPELLCPTLGGWRTRTPMTRRSRLSANDEIEAVRKIRARIPG